MKIMHLRQFLACVLLALTSACTQFTATVPTAAPEILRPPAVIYETATQILTVTPETHDASKPADPAAIPSQHIAEGARQLRNGDWLQAISTLGSPTLPADLNPDQAWAQSLHARALSNMGQHQAAQFFLATLTLARPLLNLEKYFLKRLDTIRIGKC